jgi:hypothetical protein
VKIWKHISFKNWKFDKGNDHLNKGTFGVYRVSSTFLPNRSFLVLNKMSNDFVRFDWLLTFLLIPKGQLELTKSFRKEQPMGSKICQKRAKKCSKENLKIIFQIIYNTLFWFGLSYMFFQSTILMILLLRNFEVFA